MRRFPVGPVTMILLQLPLMSSGQGGYDKGMCMMGFWACRLVWLEEPDADGKIHKPECTGAAVYTRDGRLSVQVMYRDASRGINAAPAQHSQRVRTVGQVTHDEVSGPEGTLESCLGALLTMPRFQKRMPP